MKTEVNSFQLLDILTPEAGVGKTLCSSDSSFVSYFERCCGFIANNLAPKVFLDKNEQFNPSSVEWYLSRCNVYEFIGNKVAGKLISDNAKDWLESNTGNSENYLSPKSKTTYSGEGTNAKAYCRIAIKNESIFFQYWFFYPYNGALNVDILSDPNFLCGFYAHEGGWECICVEVLPEYNNSTGVIETVKVPTLRLYRHGDCYLYKDSRPNSIPLDQLSQLEVFSCYHSHASVDGHGRYDNPNIPSFLSVLKKIDPSLYVYDYSRPNGLCWDTKGKLIFISGDEGSQLHWLKFNGAWGDKHEVQIEKRIAGEDLQVPIVKGGPSGPPFKTEWSNPDEPSSNNEILNWIYDRSNLNFVEFTRIKAYYHPQAGQSFRCSANFPHWDTTHAAYLKFQIVPDTNPVDKLPFPAPMIAIDHDKGGSDTRWYSYIIDNSTILVENHEGEPGKFSLYVGTERNDREWENVNIYPHDKSASYTVIVFKA